MDAECGLGSVPDEAGSNAVLGGAFNEVAGNRNTIVGGQVNVASGGNDGDGYADSVLGGIDECLGSADEHLTIPTATSDCIPHRE